MNIMHAFEKSPLFAGVDHPTLRQMAGAFTPEVWPKGSEIAGPAESARCFRIIVSGRVKIASSNSEDGREITLWLLARGDGFDVVSLLDGKPHLVSARALDQVETLAIPLRALQRWLERSEALRLAMNRYIAQQLRALTNLATDLAVHDTMTRLAGLLLRHFDPKAAGRDGSVNLIRDLPQEELASLVGSVRVVVGRLLGELKREAIVDIKGRALRVLDLKRLVRHAEPHAWRARERRTRRTAT